MLYLPDLADRDYRGYGSHSDYKAYPSASIITHKKWVSIPINHVVHPTHILLSIANLFQCKSSSIFYIFHHNNKEHYTQSFGIAFSYCSLCHVFAVPIYVLHRVSTFNPCHIIELITQYFDGKDRELYACDLLCQDNVFYMYKDWCYKTLNASSDSHKRIALIKQLHNAITEQIMNNESLTYHGFNTLHKLLTTQPKEHISEIVSCNVNIFLNSKIGTDTLTIYRNIACSEIIPFIQMQHYHHTSYIKKIRTFHDLEFPTKLLDAELINDDTYDGINMLYICKRNSPLAIVKSPVDKQINEYFDNKQVIKYIKVMYDSTKQILTFKFDLIYDSTYLAIAHSLCHELGFYSFEYLVTYNNCMQKQVLTNVYIYPHVLNYMLRFHPAFQELNKFVYVDEERRTCLMTQRIRLRVHINNLRITISLESFIAKRQMQLYKKKIYSGWPYTIVSYYKVSNQHVTDYIDTVLDTILSIYYQHKDEVKQIFGYTSTEDEIKTTPDIIYNIKQEVPEIWVANTSKQVTSKNIVIISERLAQEYMKRGKEVIKYPLHGHLSRYYTSANPSRPHMGLIQNTKANANEFRFLPNAYKTNHVNNTRHLYGYVQDPINYTGENKQRTRQEVYKKDYAPIKHKGFSECPKFLTQTLLGNFRSSKYNLYVYYHSKGNNRFPETMQNIFGYYEHRAVIPYLYMCKQELPEFTNSEIVDLYLKGYNPMYFVRAYEAVYDVNIVIVTCKDKQYKVQTHTAPNKKPYLILMCFLTSRTQFVYGSVYKNNSSDPHLWFPDKDPQEYENITKFMPQTKVELPSHGTIIAQNMRKDGLVTAVKLDDGNWYGCYSQPLKVPCVDLTEDMLPPYIEGKRLGCGGNTLVATERNGSVMLVKPMLVDSYDEEVFPLWYKTNSIMEQYKRVKRYMLLKKDMVTILSKYGNVEPMLFFNGCTVVDVNVDQFKVEFDNFEEAIEYYTNLGLITNGRIEFNGRDEKTIRSIGTKLELANEYVLQMEKERNVLTFDSETEYTSWKYTPGISIPIKHQLRKEKLDYILECQIGKVNYRFDVLCSLRNTMSQMREFYSTRLVIGEYKIVHNLHDLVAIFKDMEVDEYDFIPILYEYQKGVYCPVLYRSYSDHRSYNSILHNKPIEDSN